MMKSSNEKFTVLISSPLQANRAKLPLVYVELDTESIS